MLVQSERQGRGQRAEEDSDRGRARGERQRQVVREDSQYLIAGETERKWATDRSTTVDTVCALFI